MTIHKIESLKYEEALKLASETAEIKGHQIVFVDLGEHFGYSALVFKDEMHIYFANDYALHHVSLAEEGNEALRKYYESVMNNRLYTDEELMEPVKSYDEYNKKRHFLTNYYIQRYEYISIFGIGEEDEKRIKEGKKKFPFYNPVSYCYVKDESIIIKQKELASFLDKSFQSLKENLDTFREMIARELANHEAGYTCDYDDGLAALGLRFEDLSEAKKLIVKEELEKLMDA